MSGGLRHDTGKPNLLHLSEQTLRSLLVGVPYVHEMLEWFFHNTPPSIITLRQLVPAALPVLDFGARKYAPKNYIKGMLYSRVMNSFLRHAYAVAIGQVDDAESKLPHLAHMACNVLFAFTYFADGRDGSDLDDRGGFAE